MLEFTCTVHSHIDKLSLLKVIDVKAASGISLILFVNCFDKDSCSYSVLSKSAF